MASGMVKTVKAGFGFISIPGSADAFFHASDLSPELTCNELLTGRRVEFSIEQAERGPRARNVRPAT